METLLIWGTLEDLYRPHESQIYFYTKRFEFVKMEVVGAD